MCTSIGKYELIHQGKILQTEVEEYRIRLYTPEELTSLLVDAGFQNVRFMKAFQRDSSSDPHDETVVCVCQK